ncbi:hypothetical protein SDC9_194196 [bioreactor metagenome]|uniref:Uncharacterized protein n=1 Tax=bioreactor metagenome TaxID=1076179 RepID=A0A645I5L0_9ZZZZ
MNKEIEVIFKDEVDFSNRFMKFLIDLLVESNILLGEECDNNSIRRGVNKTNDK